ncbi:hypothetical protein ACHAXR_008557 [Thalassiosira sp. AJA248-18]
MNCGDRQLCAGMECGDTAQNEATTTTSAAAAAAGAHAATAANRGGRGRPLPTWTSGAAMSGFTASGADATAPSLMFTSLIPPAAPTTTLAPSLPSNTKRRRKKTSIRMLGWNLERHIDFCPLVYSVKCIPGRDARGTEKQLAWLLTYKWKRPYIQMVHYVRVRMAVAVVCAKSLLIRGSRDRTHAAQPRLSRLRRCHA